MTTYKWEFSSKFRRNGFGWKSDLPIQRIKEALSEIKSHVKKEPVLAAEGAILLLEKLSPALMHVDSSSGAIGGWVNKAIETLVPIIVKPKVDTQVRQKWLQRLWQALQDDEMPYIEHLGDFWGELCVTPELSSQWADELLPSLEEAISHKGAYFKGTTACFSALFTAQRFDEILSLNHRASYSFWSYREWAVKTLVAQGKPREAIEYAEASDQPYYGVALFCESILLDMGLPEEAYQKYAFKVNQTTTNVATFRAIVKKYPMIDPKQILQDLVNQDPFRAGKWFATAKEAGFYDDAIQFAHKSPTDIKTLTRAVRDFTETQPAFAFEAGMAALHWISLAEFYELTQGDIDEVFNLTLIASQKLNISREQLNKRMQVLVSKDRKGAKYLDKLVMKIS